MDTVDRRPRRVAAATSLLVLVALLALAGPEPADAALQRLAGFEANGENQFTSLNRYFANLRDALLPLAVPIGTIGLVVSGGMYMFGSPQASRILFGVGVGLGLVLLAPSIIA